MNGPKKWLADMKNEAEVLKLRRQALALARDIIEQDAKGMTPEEIELAACDLCDRQVATMLESKA